MNRSIQCFVRDTYGTGCWNRVAAVLDLGPDGFETMFSYDDAVTQRLMDEVVRVLDKPHDMVLEDVGTYLVSHPNTESIRRLLRFGGETFADFLHSLEDLPDRARLAVPELRLPCLDLVEESEGRFALHVENLHPGFAFVLVGVLRAMADDYGALALLDQRMAPDGRYVVDISLLDSAFAEGRRFTLARPVGPAKEAAE
ncbi:heme NO-binding domain-containing protein [Tropicimonas sp. IMCC34043]|uniref:heme NO-binding domain-containing protein n=1 Tax=Tropicimonas sp. IMCC34043 TaxID=2248760 RepID=UPI003516A4FA